VEEFEAPRELFDGAASRVLCSGGGGIALRRIVAIVSGSLVVALLLAAAAFAAEVSREEYKAAAEPICKSSSQANERILAGVRKEVQQGKLKTAAVKFAKASKEQTGALRKLEALAQPTADEARLAKWFAKLKVEAELFATAGKELKAGDKSGAQRAISKLAQNANKANVEVLPFEFHYCLLEPQKFT
jgi:hypothetical protein